MLCVGIDPGEAWCGFAVLDVSKDSVRAEARTYSVKAHGGYIGMVRHFMDILPHVRKTRIIVEDFRIRRVGHQSFNRGATLRLMGALEYAVSKVPAFSWYLVPAGNHHKENRLLFGNVLDYYRQLWPDRGQKEWDHCLSAWRVVGRHLISSDLNVLPTLRKNRIARNMVRTSRWLPAARVRGDLVAPAVQWPL